MDARSLALAVAGGRIAFGVGLMLAPRRVAASWIGPAGAHPGARLLTVAVGARDLGVGLGTTAALRSGSSARTWVLAGALADVADLAATARFRAAIPRAAAVGVGVLAASGGVISLWLASRLD